MSKTKYPRAVALAVAKELCDLLGPECQRTPDGKPWLVVAGSLRRRREEVGDVEIVYVPQVELVRGGWFDVDTKPVNRVNEVLERLLAKNILEKRQNVRGSEMWGDSNKLARHVASGVPVDLFRATPSNWFNYLVCRTGNAANNIAIAEAAAAKGWRWMPYGEGFRDQRGEVVRVNSEREVFTLAGLKYLNPWERNL